MMNIDKLIKIFLDYELSAVHPKIIEWQGINTTREILKNKIESLVNKAIKREKANIFRILELQNQKLLLIRIDETETGNGYGIDIYFSNFPLIENLEYVIHQIKTALMDKHIELISFSDSKRLNSPQIREYVYTYAGKISLIRNSEIPENYHEIELKMAENLNFYPEYQKMYEDFHKDHSDLKEIVPFESMESMKDSLEKSVINLAYIKGELAGIIMVVKIIYDEMSGYFLCDKVLSKKFRGGGFGIAFERKFIDSLKTEGNELIFGTINAKNMASYKTTEKVGRICVKIRYHIESDIIEK